jgi:hypothetical protein
MKALADRVEEFEVCCFPFLISFPRHAKIWKCLEFSGIGKTTSLVLSTSFKSYGGAMLMLLMVMFSLRLMPSRTAFASTFEEKQLDAKFSKEALYCGADAKVYGFSNG